MTLPESVIREIFPEIVEALSLFYLETDSAFGGLSPSQVLLTEEGKVCLGMGLYYHFPHANPQSIYNIRANRPKYLSLDTVQSNSTLPKKT